jgi:hypothetical protein
VKNYPEFRDAMDEALENHEELGKKACEYVKSELGATDKIYKALF